MKRFALLASFFAIFLAACGPIGVQAHTISLAYKSGDTYKYGLHIVLKYTIGMQGLSVPFNVDMSGKETVKVKSVDSTGMADLSIALTDISVKTTANGTTNTTTTPTGTTVEVKVGSDGRIVSVNGNAFGSAGTLPGMTGSEGGLVSAILPDKPVKPGDTWTKSYDQANPMHSAGSYHVTTDNKYLRDEKVGSVQTAVVESNIKANLDLSFDVSSLNGQGATPILPGSGAAGGLKGMSLQGTSTSDVTTWIDTGARRIVKSHSTGGLDATMTITLAPGTTSIPGLTGPITFKGTETLDMNPV
ncbi:MAG TPA: hypothetical protein VJQ08_01335 [Candidatus Dormibacteraeota bacterium]|nr:hypothetical protein [Candidatus Dormibacteraeota bacterium]